MFTGLIEETGTVSCIKNQNNGAIIKIDCSRVLDDLKLGDSIAIDGACQTVTKLTNSGFQVETSKETLDLTILNSYKRGQIVNLERAMLPNSRFGGHIVTGHVKGTGKFIRKISQGIAWSFYFSAPQNVLQYMIYKGSITVNGISLTTASLQGDIFSVAVIPTTLKETNLGFLAPGGNVNLEPDVLAKYVEKFIQKPAQGKITESYLEEHGFL